MAETLFVSDVHLAPERPALLALFTQFLATRARYAAQVYFLGDLFERWIGDDDPAPAYQAVIAQLRALRDHGTQCHLMVGNRDFLLGRRFMHAAGCQPIPDPSIIVVAGERVLLSHGDHLCTDDLAYQRFRRRVRHPLLQWLFLLQPLARRQQIAQRYRQQSQTATARKSTAIMDVNHHAVVAALTRHQSLRLVHGHTHRPADHQLNMQGQSAQRHVLAAWDDQRGELLATAQGNWWRESVTPLSTWH